jgi:hypothetical protein
MKLVIVFRTIFRYSKWGKMSQIESDTFGFRDNKKKQTSTSQSLSATQEKTNVDKNSKADKNAKKAKARF